MNQNEFVVAYGEYIYTTAYKCYWKLKGKPSTEEETDLVCDIAVKIIETFSTQIIMGKFNFKGDSKITTYIYGAVFNAMRETLFGKQYFPRAITPLGEAGRILYNLRYIHNYPRKEALELTCQETGMNWEEIDQVDKQLTRSLKTTLVESGNKKQQKEVGESQLDEYLGEVIFTHSATPETELLRGEMRTKILSILQNLREDHRELIILRFIEGREMDIIQHKFKMKDKQSVYNQLHSAKKAFIKEAKKQKLEEWIDFTIKGLENERRTVSQ